MGILDVCGATFGTNMDIRTRSGGQADVSNSTIGGEQFRYEDGSTGSVSNSQFTSAELVLYSSAVDIDNNTFSESDPVTANATLVPELYDNTFSNVNTTIHVDGSVTADTTWQAFSNVSRYKMYSDVTVETGGYAGHQFRRDGRGPLQQLRVVCGWYSGRQRCNVWYKYGRRRSFGRDVSILPIRPSAASTSTTKTGVRDRQPATSSHRPNSCCTAALSTSTTTRSVNPIRSLRTPPWFRNSTTIRLAT